MEKVVPKAFKITIIILLWSASIIPFLGLFSLLYIADDGTLPGFDELENPKTNLASVIYTADAVELGKYYHQNRTNVSYNELSPWLIKALIATEDERYYDHSGVDVRALGRVVKGVVSGNSSQGGGSTISQQLSKLLFPREKLSKWGLVKRKFKEWIIASRLEKNYTKNEIICMYFNKFDFLNNAVGINSAANIYFNKSPNELNLEEASMLVGMAKNPSLFNPLRYPEKVLKRREVVLKQMKKNEFINQHTYDSVRKLPLGLNYTRVDHQAGLAPYFRESLRAELGNIFSIKDENDNYVIAKSDGSPYDIYADGLKIYTTIDSRIQTYAEFAVAEHLKYQLQKDFFRNNKRWKRPPFSNDLKQEQIDNILNRAAKQTKTYKKHTGQICGYCERSKKYISEIDQHFQCSYCDHRTPIISEQEIFDKLNQKRNMKIFDWQAPNYELDTLMSSMDSIRYYKGLLRASLVSMDPHNGHVKAWVGGPHYKHFKYDMVYKGKRQVGSTFKPFVYASAIEIGAIHPCDEIPDNKHCVEIPYNENRNDVWCPENAGAEFTHEMTPISVALAKSMNNITASIIKNEGMINEVFNRISQLGIDTSSYLRIPAMALGVFDISIYNMVGAMCSFANNGIYIAPTFIVKVEDKYGNIIYEPTMEAKQVWNNHTAYTMLQLMKEVTIRGTGARIRYKATEKRPYTGIKQPVAGKTGTTQNQSDGWFMGITPDLVTGVWVGAEDRSVRFKYVSDGMGSNMALPIWAYYTKKINADSTLKISQEDFEMPLDILKDPLDCTDYQLFKNVQEEFNEGDQMNDIWNEEEEDIW